MLHNFLNLCTIKLKFSLQATSVNYKNEYFVMNHILAIAVV